MAILAVANRLRDFDTIAGTPTEATTAGSFDSAYVAGSLSFTSMSDGVTRLFPASPGDVTWFRFTINRVGSGSSVTTSSSAIEIKDASGNVLVTVDRSSPTSASSRWTLHGATDAVSAALSLSTSENRTYTVKLDQTGAGSVLEIYFGLTDLVLQERLTVADRETRGKPVSFFISPPRLNYSQAYNMYLSELMIASTPLFGSRLIAQAPATVGDLADYAGTLADLNTDNPATGLTTDAAGERHTWTAGAFSGAAANLEGLAATGIAHRPVGTPARLASMFRIGGVNYDEANILIDNPTRFIQDWPLNPSTAAPWTTAQLAGLQTGLKTVA